MDREVQRLQAHLDQTRSELREALSQMTTPQVAALIKACASARFDDLDDKERLLVGLLLAVTCIFDLKADSLDEA
jgi:hypothetical protein